MCKGTCIIKQIECLKLARDDLPGIKMISEFFPGGLVLQRLCEK